MIRPANDNGHADRIEEIYGEPWPVSVAVFVVMLLTAGMWAVAAVVLWGALG